MSLTRFHPSAGRSGLAPLAVFLAIALGGAGFLSALLFLSTPFIDGPAIKEQERIFNEQQLLQTSLVSQSIQERIGLIKSDLEILSRRQVRAFLDGRESRAELEALLADEVALGHDYLAMGLLPLGADGRFGPAIEPPGKDPAPLGQALSWAKARWPRADALRPETAAVSELAITGERQWLGLLVPVADKGRPQGVLACIIDLSRIMERQVKPMRSGQYGAGYVLDDRGGVVFDHETEIIGENVFGGMHEDYPDVLRYDRRLLAEPKGMDSYHFTVERGGEVRRKLAAWSRVDLGGRFLVIALSAPGSETEAGMAALRSQRTILTIVMAALVLAFSALFFAWRQRILVRNARHLKDEVDTRTAELRMSRDTLSAMMESSPLAIAWADRSGPVEYTNPAFLLLFGYSAADLADLAAWFAKAYPDEGYRAEVTGRWSAAMEESLRSGRPMEPQLARITCADGRSRMVSVLGAVVGSRILAIFTDLTESLSAKERIETSLKEKETLLRELYHRTKNNLYVIYSLLMLHADGAESGEAREVLGEMAMRIQSMALVHQMLYQSGNLSSIDMKEYVEQLLSLVAGNFAAAGTRIERRLRLQNAGLPLERAVPLGLVLNELFTNAFRHAFMPLAGQPDFVPVLEVVLERGPGGWLFLEVGDNGKGMPGGFDEGRDANMGLETVIALVRGQLGGKIEFHGEAGFRCRVAVPEGDA